MAAQTVLPRNEVSIGISLMFFAQTLFGAIFVSVGQNVLDNQLAKRLAGISSITPQQIEAAGATDLFNIIPPQYHTAALEAYNDSLRVCFQVALILACLSILGALGMEWRSVKKNKENPPPKNPDSEQAIEEGKGGSDSSGEEAKDAEAFNLTGAVADKCTDKNEDATAGANRMFITVDQTEAKIEQ
ncbi:hypothetical protein MMC18_008154 [Xylographa bjoerkii]|nr:hypothetical protein [Xylographa bjoerkii]